MSEATGRWRWATPASWVVFAVCAVVVLGSTLTHDFRDESIAGDTGGHLMQALSLAYDSHSLNFDAKDLERWKELGWAQEPVGMFFQRYDGDRYGVAKPYGYSLYLSPFIAVLGPVHGVAMNAASAPVANAPPAPPLRLTKAGVGISNNPLRLSDKATVNSNSTTIARGSCNWKAQPTAVPPARSARITPPSPTHTETTPAA